MAGTKQRTNSRTYQEFDSYESYDSFSDVITTNTKEFASDFWSQLLGGGEQPAPSHGDLTEGQEMVFGQKPKSAEKPSMHKEAGINYAQEIVHSEKRVAQETAHAIRTQVEEILIELKKLVVSSKELEAQFKDVAQEPTMANPGKYHVNFFQWVLLTVRQARMKVEDSGAWLGVMKSKKAAKQYWNQFKKSGTSFALSNERTVATQTG